MSKTKLEDILRNKNAGDEWYAIEAPEELRCWIQEHRWKADIFRDNGLSLAGIKVESSDQTGKLSVDRYTPKNPMRLKCGAEIYKGQFGTTTTKKMIAKFRTDGVIEMNEVMNELCDFTGLTSWDIKQLEVYNSDKGATIEFEVHDPDSNGKLLYVYAVHRNGSRRFYHEVLISEQQELLNSFQNRFAHCTAGKFNLMGHTCALRKKTPKKQIKRRKKKKSNHAKP